MCLCLVIVCLFVCVFMCLYLCVCGGGVGECVYTAVICDEFWHSNSLHRHLCTIGKKCITRLIEGSYLSLLALHPQLQVFTEYTIFRAIIGRFQKEHSVRPNPKNLVKATFRLD